MSMQSLQLQQMALTKLKSHLVAFKDDLINQMERYRNIVEGLHEDGLSDEVYRTYLNSYYERDRSYVNQLINHMEEADVPYVNKNLEETGINQEVANTGWDW